MQAFKYRVSCPRWALPAEEVPIHVEFDKSLTPLLQSVSVTLDESLDFRDYINLTDYEPNGRTLKVNAIGKSTRSAYDYFGFAVATRAPFEDLKKLVPVGIRFNYRDGTSETHTEYARIFRPRLELGESPDEITITDANADRLRLPIAMKFSGFGQIKVRAECLIEGRIVSFASSMLHEIVRKMASGGMDPGEAHAEQGVRISHGYVEQTAAEISGLLQDREEVDKILGELRDGSGADDLYALSQESKEKTVRSIYGAVEMYATQVIAEILERNPGANLAMEPTRIHTHITLPVTRVTVRLRYRDLVGNEYDPVEKQVKIVDRRKSPTGLDVKIPLSVTNVDESLAYKNVRKMEIDPGE